MSTICPHRLKKTFYAKYTSSYFFEYGNMLRATEDYEKEWKKVIPSNIIDLISHIYNLDLGDTQINNHRHYKLENSSYNKENDTVELHFLVEEDEFKVQDLINEERTKRVYYRIWSFFKTKCYKHIPGTSHDVLETEAESCTEGCESPGHRSVGIGENVPSADYEELQLVTLDVRTLRNVQHTWRNLTPPSSIDLEWEHEGAVGNISAVCHRRLLSTTEECSIGSVPEGSPAESLEWDSGDGALDTDTEQLLCEIERLTDRALRETGGDWANR